jgi:hypothetical protein
MAARSTTVLVHIGERVRPVNFSGDRGALLLAIKTVFSDVLSSKNDADIILQVSSAITKIHVYIHYHVHVPWHYGGITAHTCIRGAVAKKKLLALGMYQSKNGHKFCNIVCSGTVSLVGHLVFYREFAS